MSSAIATVGSCWPFTESTAATPLFPHLHVSDRLLVPNPTTDPDAIPLDKLHLPTGRVSPRAPVRMLIEEFGVRPLTPSWQARLTEAGALLGEGSDDG